jgi:predicted transcriptional regulator
MPRKVTKEQVADHLLAHPWSSSRHLAIDLGVSVSTVRCYLREFRQDGLLIEVPYWLSQFGYTRLYSLRDPYSP